MVRKILFIHHSTGGNLIKEGKLRDELRKMSPYIELWDHSYNLYPFLPKTLALFTHHKGLSDKNGKITGSDYDIVLSNNNPKEYADIFTRSVKDKTLSSILQYDVIAFKNCYPTTKITSFGQLERYKDYYLTVFKGINRFKNKKFILLTPPPLRKELTNKSNAKRARELVHWLNKVKNKPSNVYVFDLFSLLANKEGFLKKEYTRTFPWDSHPNKTANNIISPLLARYLLKVT